MPLDGKTFQQIQDALLDSFFNKTDLAQMVKRELGEDLDEIAGGENFKEITFNLLRWAETQDKVDLLLKNARDYNPNNRSLCAVAEKFDPITQRTEEPPAERGKSKVGMWLGLAALLIVVVFVGKLVLDRTPAKTSRRPGIRHPLKLSAEQLNRLQKSLTYTREALKNNTKAHTDMADYYLAEAESIDRDDPAVKDLRQRIDNRRRSATGE